MRGLCPSDEVTKGTVPLWLPHYILEDAAFQPRNRTPYSTILEAR